MSSMKKTIAKNASVLMASQLITWSLALLLTIILPRYLGVAGIGKLVLANSLWAIGSVFISFGMGILITKEIARKAEATAELFSTTIVVRTFLYVIAFVAIIIFAKVVDYPSDTILIVYIVGISVLFGQYAGAGRASLAGLERMEFIALADIVGKAVNVAVSIALVLLGFDIMAIAAVSIVTALVTMFIQLFSLNRLQKLSIHLDMGKAKWLLKSSLPYFATDISIILYHQIDTIIISLFIGEVGVGLYGVVDTLFGTLLFIPSVFLTAVYPALSRMYADSPSSMPKVMSKSFDLLLMIGVPMGLGLVAVSNSLVVLLYGADFAKSGPILTIKGIVLIFTYQTILIGTFLLSIDRQKAWAIIMATATVATIPLDMIFIPLFETFFNNGAMGGAFAYLITEIGMAIAGISLLPKGTLGRQNGWSAIKVVLAGLSMFIVAWMLRSYFIAVPVIAGVIVYSSLIILLRVLPKDDWLSLKQIAQQIITRITRKQPEPSGIGG